MIQFMSQMVNIVIPHSLRNLIKKYILYVKINHLDLRTTIVVAPIAQSREPFSLPSKKTEPLLSVLRKRASMAALKWMAGA